MKHWEHLNYSSPCLSLFIRKHKNSKSICQFAGLIYKNDKTLVLVDLSNKCLPSMECQAWIIKAQIKSYMEFEGTWKTTSSCPDRLQIKKLRSSGGDRLPVAILWSNLSGSLLFSLQHAEGSPWPPKNKPFSQNWHMISLFFRCSKGKKTNKNQLVKFKKYAIIFTYSHIYGPLEQVAVKILRCFR